MVALKAASLGAMLIQAGLAAASTAAATPWLGGGAIIAAAAITGALISLGAMAVDDFKAGPGGINYMSGPAGEFELNPRDSVLATTNKCACNSCSCYNSPTTQPRRRRRS
jgi:hypothetical protein